MRPSKFTQEIADKICERLAEGESLRKICTDDHLPYKATIFRWLAKEEYSEFRDQYARAREAQAEALADEILFIADEKVEGSDQAQRQRLRVDARKWVAAKLLPKKYGEKQQLEVKSESIEDVLRQLHDRRQGRILPLQEKNRQ